MSLLLFLVAGLFLGGAISMHRQGLPRVSAALVAASMTVLGAWVVFYDATFS